MVATAAIRREHRTMSLMHPWTFSSVIRCQMQSSPNKDANLLATTAALMHLAKVWVQGMPFNL